MSYAYNDLYRGYIELWNSMEIHKNRLPILKSTAQRILKNRPRYEEIQQATGVPWWFTGLLHLRESNCNFDTHLHNGDTLLARTTHVPPNRPPNGTPPFSFEFSALDALKMKGYDKIEDWNIARVAYNLEKYNGFGYQSKGINSPYLWASSDHYEKGKYVSDGAKGWRPNHVDTQLGCMPTLKILLDMTPEDELGDVKPTVPEVSLSPKSEIEEPTSKELNQTSRKYWYSSILEYLGWGGAATGGALKVASDNDLAPITLISMLKTLAPYGITILLVSIAALALYFTYQKKLMREDVKEGRFQPSKSVTPDDTV